MKKLVHSRFSLSLLLIVSMLSPLAVFAGSDGKKRFNQGVVYETSEQWDKAVEEFAMAVAENPKSPEYRLHYQRALFNASQMFMKKGNSLAEEKDYAGAFLAYRRAYAYDPVNELAKSEMSRMLRLQQAIQNGENSDDQKSDSAVKLVNTAYGNQANSKNTPPVPQKIEKLRDVPFPGGIDLQYLIKELAKDLDLNVLFDSETFRPGALPKAVIELKQVTAAEALDYVFLQQGLFFQKVGPHTILVASQNRRQNFQQLVLRTFYLANAAPADVAKVVQTAIPAQPGRTPTIVLTDAATNSITIRDTTENIRLIGKLIDSLDKDRPEVVMDVQIYEVNKTDLLQLGNQIGDSTSLTTLGGTTRGVVGLGGSDIYGGTAATTAASLIPRAFGVGFVVPAVNLVAFQNKNNSKLLASTQIHAFNNEDSSARIGQRVPVRSASFAPVANTGGTTTGSNNFVGDVINYEQVGLTLKFTPIVFPNQDVQVKMEIESKDVSGAQTLTPTFTERTIKGTARIQNNKTLLLASVAQGVQSNGRQGLPLLGLVPILGRLFTAPTKDNRQVDIVIAVTPRVIRAPAILPEDLIERKTGSLATPTSGSIQAMVTQDEEEDLLAAARRIGSSVAVQLPDQKGGESPVYVKSNGNNQQNTAVAQTETPTETTPNNASPVLTKVADNSAAPLNVQPIESKVKTLQIEQTSDKVETPANNEPAKTTKTPESAAAENSDGAKPIAAIQLIGNSAEMKTGEKAKIGVLVQSGSSFRSALLGLRFDDKKTAVRAVSFGNIFGAGLENTPVAIFQNQNGKAYMSFNSLKDTTGNTTGILAWIEIEALTDGKQELSLDTNTIKLMTADGKDFAVKY